MEAVVAAQCSQGAQPDGIGKEDLGASINPDLGCEGGCQGVSSTQLSAALPTALTCASTSLVQSGFR